MVRAGGRTLGADSTLMVLIFEHALESSRKVFKTQISGPTPEIF